MDVLSVASTVALSTQAQSASQTQNTTKAAEGTVPFQQQLNQYAMQTDSKETNTATVAVSESTAISDVQLQLTQLNTDELLAMIEGLIEQLEQLNDVPLTEDNQAALDAASLQLMALLQLIMVDNKHLLQDMEQQAQTNQVTTLQMSNTQQSDLLYKLQDQLMLLQQALKDGNVKVVQGQQPEQLIASSMAQFKQLLTQTKADGKEQLINQLLAQSTQTVEVEPMQLHQASLAQLKQLAKLGEYAQIAANQAQAGSTQATMVTEAVPINVQHVMPFDAQLNQPVSLLKAQPQAPAFTMVNQFADTVKTMVLQKFDITSLQGLSEARIMLTPEHLGSVDIKLSMQNGILTAVFQTETALAKDALDNQMAVLRSSLAAQGITVDRLEVSQAAFAQELDWQEQRHQQATQQSNEDQTDEEGFDEQLEKNNAIQELGYGRSVNEMV